jgi:signal transduction histidine kinase
LRSLYTRILVAFWAVMVLIVAGSVGMTWLMLAERSEELPRVSADLVQGAALVLRERGEAGLRAWLLDPRNRRAGFRVLVVTPDGRELLGRPVPSTFEHGPPGPPGPPGSPPPGVTAQAQVVDVDGRAYGIALVPAHHGLEGVELTEMRIAVLILALIATGIASGLLTRSITRPVRALGAATRAIAGGDLAVRLDPAVSGRRDELGTLGRDFDAMAQRLAELLQGREQLLRDVSHELRSPLARMRVAAGLARQPGSDTGREITRIESEIDRLDRLIGQMLHLSRLDARAGLPLDEQVDLVDLIDGIARDAAFEAQAHDVGVHWQPPATSEWVRGNAALLASAVENVVRNAIAYSPARGTVSVELRRTASGHAIVVSDRGPGVPAAELERIFEPFHRVAESRTRDSGGDGIGLAITSRVMAAHGGRACAENRPGGGLVVTLSLPPGGAGHPGGAAAA